MNNGVFMNNRDLSIMNDEAIDDLGREADRITERLLKAGAMGNWPVNYREAYPPLYVWVMEKLL